MQFFEGISDETSFYSLLSCRTGLFRQGQD